MGGTNSVAVPWAGRSAGCGARSGGAGSVTHALSRGASFDRARALRVPLALLFVVHVRVSVEYGVRAETVPRPRQGSAWCWQSSTEGQQPTLDVARRLKGQTCAHDSSPSNPQVPEPPLVKGEGSAREPRGLPPPTSNYVGERCVDQGQKTSKTGCARSTFVG